MPPSTLIRGIQSFFQIYLPEYFNIASKTLLCSTFHCQKCTKNRFPRMNPRRSTRPTHTHSLSSCLSHTHSISPCLTLSFSHSHTHTLPRYCLFGDNPPQQAPPCLVSHPISSLPLFLSRSIYRRFETFFIHRSFDKFIMCASCRQPSRKDRFVILAKS